MLFWHQQQHASFTTTDPLDCMQVVIVVGQEVAAQCKDQCAPSYLVAELQQLLASLVAAAHLSGHALLPQQVGACSIGGVL